MKTKVLLSIILIATMVVPYGCQSYGSQMTPLTSHEAGEVGSPPAAPMMTTPMTTPSPSVAEAPAGPQTAVTLAREDLARRLGVAVARIAVRAAEAVEWPDTSLGCPQPGQMYAQVITPGHRIILEVDEEQYEYHSDEEGKQLVLCQDDDKKRIEILRQMVSPERGITSAQEDLAGRLGIPVEEVTVVSVVGDEFPASNLGCPCPECPDLPLPAMVTGQRITLAAQGKSYEYRARRGMVVYCGEL